VTVLMVLAGYGSARRPAAHTSGVPHTWQAMCEVWQACAGVRGRGKPVELDAARAAFGEIWPQDAPPPAITVAFVSDLGPDGALVEIEAVAAAAA